MSSFLDLTAFERMELEEVVRDVFYRVAELNRDDVEEIPDMFVDEISDERVFEILKRVAGVVGSKLADAFEEVLESSSEVVAVEIVEELVRRGWVVKRVERNNRLTSDLTSVKTSKRKPRTKRLR